MPPCTQATLIGESNYNMHIYSYSITTIDIKKNNFAISSTNLAYVVYEDGMMTMTQGAGTISNLVYLANCQALKSWLVL